MNTPSDIATWARALVRKLDALDERSLDDFIEPKDDQPLWIRPGVHASWYRFPVIGNPSGDVTRGLRPSGKSKSIRKLRDEI